MKIIALLLTLAFSLSLLGCNTVEGAGKDMKAAGDAIKDEASQDKGY